MLTLESFKKLLHLCSNLRFNSATRLLKDVKGDELQISFNACHGCLSAQHDHLGTTIPTCRELGQAFQHI